MFGILDSTGPYEMSFDTIEEAKAYVEDNLDYDNFEDIVIVEFVPQLKACVPPKKIVWEKC